MTPFSVASVSAASRAYRPRRERGVVLFIALLVMVALSLAGIALIRSADTATIVAGNLAFKQAAAAAVDRSIEQAVDRLFNPVADLTQSDPKIKDKTTDLAAQNYFACVQDDAGGCLLANAPIPEIPNLLTTKAGAATLNSGLFLNTVLDFLIVAFAIFLLIKQVNRWKRNEPAPPAPPPSQQEVLLGEIRDLLAKR
jgi:large-conductance mechanosensitive channel